MNLQEIETVAHLAEWTPRRVLLDALRRSGLQAGDAVFVQASDAVLADLENNPAGLPAAEVLRAVLAEVVGTEGTLFVPAFTSSFLRQQIFDPERSPILAEWDDSAEFAAVLSSTAGWVRSLDPNASICGFGPAAPILLALAPTTYGAGSFFDRFIAMKGKLCILGSAQPVTPFVHYVEEQLGVPFRYRKLCTGLVQRGRRTIRQGWVTSVALDTPQARMHCSRIAALLQRVGTSEDAGTKAVLTVRCDILWETLRSEIVADSWFTAVGPAGDPATLESRGHSVSTPITLPPDASMSTIIDALWRLPRHIVSDGYDIALRALATQVPMTIHEYPSGTECWSWIVPEKWTCHEARLETLDGQRIFSVEDNPLHVVAYSLPCERVVSREELLPHLHTHSELPDAIPFIFKYYERDWGLCLSQTQKAALTDSHYRVVIDSAFTRGALKVGDIVARGRSPQTFIFCAHLCHPAMVNDDLSGVVVGLKVMQALLARHDLHYTYRFLILPETIGSVAWLSHNETLIPDMIGGLFLEMLGLDEPHALQLSAAGDTELDRCFTEVLAAHDSAGWTGAFRTVVGNDERQFNAPGIRVPMLSLSRVQKRAPGRHPYYSQYHSSFDTPDLAPETRLTASKDLVLAMVDMLEHHVVPVNRFKGEICCSRYGLHVDAYEDPEGNRALFDILFLIDGTRSEREIARLCHTSEDTVRRLVTRLEGLGLVELRRIGQS